MTSVGTVATQAGGISPAVGAGGRGGSDLRTLATTADVPTLAVHIRQHPGQRDQIERAMVAAGRTGDVSRLAQALKTPDYDTSIWLRYGSAGGPGYANRPATDDTNRVRTSPAWDGLTRAGTVTDSERRVISRMADNEGRLDSVQAYDSEIATMGAMQKTINATGTGELPKQVWDFAQANPEKYRTLFADHGWTVEHTGKGSTASDYTMRLTVDGTTMSARETAAYIKDRANPDHWTTALDPLLKAGRDADFQAQQIGDFKTRLDTAMAVVPRGKAYTQPISAYVTSEQGAALVIDQHVNRPGHVAGSLGRALDGFFAANPKASSDPTQWTATQREAYEPEIVANYQAQRAASTMTDPVKRYDHIVAQSTPLSAAPGSFVATTR